MMAETMIPLAEARALEQNNVARDPAADAATVARLATLPALDYERHREAEAKALGIRVVALDRLVKGASNNDNDDADPFGDLDLWPDHVDGSDLLDELAATITRHVVLPAGAAEAAALWVLHAHAHDTAAISPIMAITSPSPECGKTTTLTILSALVPKPLAASNITAAALFRAVEKWSPTLLIDEADTFLRDSDELRGIINSGHNRAAAFVIRTTGDDHDPRRFNTWSPKAIALIGKLPATLESRSINVELRRLGPGETVVPLRADRLGHLVPLARKAARFAFDNAVTLAVADPILPVSLNGRRADNWRHLLSIADAAGGSWPERARRVAESMTANDAGQTAGILLLDDLRTMFADRAVGRLTSREIAETLAAMLDRPWPEWSNGRALTERQIAKLLGAFKVNPKVIRTATGTPRGYLLDDLLDAFGRYLPETSATPQQARETAGFGAVRSATRQSDVADTKDPKPAENLECCGVADTEPTRGREGEL